MIKHSAVYLLVTRETRITQPRKRMWHYIILLYILTGFLLFAFVKDFLNVCLSPDSKI